MKKVLVIAAIVAVSFLAFRGCFGGWTTSWNQRLTLVIETPQGDVRGSAVTRVENVTTGVFADSSPRVRWTGEALALEVLPGRWLFALLDSDGAVDAGHWVYTAYDLWASGGVYGYHFPNYDAVRTRVLAQPLDTPVPLPLQLEGGPMLVTFDDITKPETVREVDPANLAAVFGEGVRLKAVTLEITRDAVTERRVEGVLGWICDYTKNYRRLNGKTGAIFDNELSNNLGPGAFKIGGCG
ncbi:hypothetical protein [Tabrizicola sp.]|uniref:hypothetical protein n=1 Tax=Tabrizicola sp. TaxID=2005166 RepID=UPI003F318C4E